MEANLLFSAFCPRAYNSFMGLAVRLRRHSVFAFSALSAFLLVLPVHAQERRGRKYTPPPPVCKITVTVVKATNGKPVESAAVVFHPIRDNKDEGGMELKTNEDGQAVLDVIPIGDTLRLQIIKDGFQTFGNDYPVTADTKEIVVHLRAPARQYSIYEKHDNSVEEGGPMPPAASKPAPQSSNNAAPQAKNEAPKDQQDGQGSAQNGSSNSSTSQPAPQPNQ
jgi:hypothetical protein